MTEPQIEAGARALAAYERDEVAFQPPILDGVTRSGNSEDYYRKRAAIVLGASLGLGAEKDEQR